MVQFKGDDCGVDDVTFVCCEVGFTFLELVRHVGTTLLAHHTLFTISGHEFLQDFFYKIEELKNLGLYKYRRVGCTMRYEDCHLVLCFLYPSLRLAIGCNILLNIGVRSQGRKLSWLMCRQQHRLHTWHFMQRWHQVNLPNHCFVGFLDTYFQVYVLMGKYSPRLFWCNLVSRSQHKNIGSYY